MRRKTNPIAGHATCTSATDPLTNAPLPPPSLPALGQWRSSISTRHLSSSRRVQAKLRRLYLDTLTQDLTTLMLALSGGEMSQAHRSAHRIKGAAMLTGDTPMVNAMEALQKVWARATSPPTSA
jgi:HPt (histidine-containing phosphotransfer) domain-containing protein